MSDVINRTTAELRKSVNTNDFPEAEWIINPDLSAVEAVPHKYWKVSGDEVVEMTQSEKDQKDAKTESEVIGDLIAEADRRFIKAFIKVLMVEINQIRQFAGLEPRTFDQFKQAIRNNL